MSILEVQRRVEDGGRGEEERMKNLVKRKKKKAEIVGFRLMSVVVDF